VFCLVDVETEHTQRLALNDDMGMVLCRCRVRAAHSNHAVDSAPNRHPSADASSGPACTGRPFSSGRGIYVFGGKVIGGEALL